VVACDVRTTFIDAARTFAPQKGASPAQVTLLERRLERLAQLYLERHGSDVADVEGSGAGGGLAGGLAAVAGAELVPGFDLVAEATGLDDAMVGAELVVTAEGFVDSESMNGKVVGGVVDLASAAGVEVIVVAGDVYDEVEVDVRSLVERFGPERARTEAPACIEEVVFEELRAR
jgi:glycerate 2-kinase